MPAFLKQVFKQVHALSDVEEAWAEEIEHRLTAFDRGELSAYLAEDVFADARQLSPQSEVPKP